VCHSCHTRALEEGLRACFLIDREQFLETFSVSLVRECLHGRMSQRNRSLSTQFSESGSLHGHNEYPLSVVCVHVALYNKNSASQVAGEITRSLKSLNIPILKVGEASRASTNDDRSRRYKFRGEVAGRLC
jgi:hypothetical protein